MTTLMTIGGIATTEILRQKCSLPAVGSFADGWAGDAWYAKPQAHAAFTAADASAVPASRRAAIRPRGTPPV